MKKVIELKMLHGKPIAPDNDPGFYMAHGHLWYLPPGRYPTMLCPTLALEDLPPGLPRPLVLIGGVLWCVAVPLALCALAWWRL